jgi:hypothetical protein
VTAAFFLLIFLIDTASAFLAKGVGVRFLLRAGQNEHHDERPENDFSIKKSEKAKTKKEN